MVDESWERVAVPMLEWVGSREAAEHYNRAQVMDLARELDVSNEAAWNELQRLISGRYIEVRFIPLSAGNEHQIIESARLLERGSRVVGQWPSNTDAYAGLLELLDKRLSDDTVDDEEKGKLRKLRESVVSVGTSTAGGLLLAFVKQQVGLP